MAEYFITAKADDGCILSLRIGGSFFMSLRSLEGVAYLESVGVGSILMTATSHAVNIWSGWFQLLRKPRDPQNT